MLSVVTDARSVVLVIVVQFPEQSHTNKYNLMETEI